MASTKN
jgi:hypothetical protein